MSLRLLRHTALILAGAGMLSSVSAQVTAQSSDPPASKLTVRAFTSVPIPKTNGGQQVWGMPYLAVVDGSATSRQWLTQHQQAMQQRQVPIIVFGDKQVLAQLQAAIPELRATMGLAPEPPRYLQQFLLRLGVPGLPVMIDSVHQQAWQVPPQGWQNQHENQQ